MPLGDEVAQISGTDFLKNTLSLTTSPRILCVEYKCPLYVSTYVYMYVCIMYVCVCVCMCVCMYVSTCVYVCIMYVCMYVCVCILYVCIMYVCICVCVCMCVCMYYVCRYEYLVYINYTHADRRL